MSERAPTGVYYFAVIGATELATAVGVVHAFDVIDNSALKATDQANIRHLRSENTAIITLEHDGVLNKTPSIETRLVTNTDQIHSLIAHEPAQLPNYEEAPLVISAMLGGVALGFGLAYGVQRGSKYVWARIRPNTQKPQELAA